MSTWDEKAHDASVKDRHALYDEDIDGYFFGGFGNESDAQDHGFRHGARWQRDHLLSDEAVERAAEAVHHARGLDDYGVANEDEMEDARGIARAVLNAATGDGHE